MLNVIDKEHYDTVRGWAEENGLLEKLQESLDYLDGYAESNDKGRTRCDLYRDFAPNSFSFTMYLKDNEGEYKRWFNGGLIFHEGAGTGAEYPVLSVDLSGRTDARWQVHT